MFEDKRGRITVGKTGRLKITGLKGGEAIQKAKQFTEENTLAVTAGSLVQKKGNKKKRISFLNLYKPE